MTRNKKTPSAVVRRASVFLCDYQRSGQNTWPSSDRKGSGTVSSSSIRARMLEEDTVPEPFRSEDGQVFWPDLW